MAEIVSVWRGGRIPQPTMVRDEPDSLDCVFMLLDTEQRLELRIRRSDDALCLLLDGELIAWIDGRLLRSREISTE